MIRRASVSSVAAVLAWVTACASHSSDNSGGDGGGLSGGSSGASSGSGGNPGSSSGTAKSSSGGDAGGIPYVPSNFPPYDGGAVLFSLNLSQGPARQFDPPSSPVPISPYVYGVNAFAAWESTTQWGLLRWGGNAFTAWNWTNNYGNSGADFCFSQVQESGGGGLAATVGGTTYPSVGTAGSRGTASLVTVPILGSVASSAVTNNVWQGSNPPCPGTPPSSCATGQPSGDDLNVGNLQFVSTDPSSHAFVANNATKTGALCTCAGTGCGSCAVNTTGAVYEDEYVNYMKTTYSSMSAPLFFMLDNEPNYWPSTHPELWPYTGTLGCGTSGTVTFEQIVQYDTTFATAIKATWPDTKVFGPVVAQDGIIIAGDQYDPNFMAADGGVGTIFTDYYLQKMAAASASAGHALLDSYDVHYYTSNGSNAQCVQVPRMFWDPSFTDFTPEATYLIDFGWSGPNNYFNTWYPRQMIPRLQGDIAAAYTGTGATAPGLSFSEYNPGCETAIQGGLAEADLLGVFGREGVFAATAWPLQTVANGTTLTNYLVAAFDLYRNYDGHGATVGDTTAYAQTANVEETSVYAFTHSGDPSQVEVVAINKTSNALPVTLQIGAAPALTTATAYNLVMRSTVGVTAATGTALAISCTGTDCTVTYTLPALSASTIVLR